TKSVQPTQLPLQLRKSNHVQVESQGSPYFRAHFHGTRLGRAASRSRVRQKVAATEGYRRIMGNCRSPPSTEHRTQRLRCAAKLCTNSGLNIETKSLEILLILLVFRC